MNGGLEIRKLGVDHYRVVDKEGNLGGKVFEDTFVNENSWIDYSSEVSGNGVILIDTKIKEDCTIYAPNVTFNSCNFGKGASVDIMESPLSFCNSFIVGLSMGNASVLKVYGNVLSSVGRTAILDMHMVVVANNASLEIKNTSETTFSCIKVKFSAVKGDSSLFLHGANNYIDLRGVTLEDKNSVVITRFGNIHMHNTKFKRNPESSEMSLSLVGDYDENRLLFIDNAEVYKSGSYVMNEKVINLSGVIE